MATATKKRAKKAVPGAEVPRSAGGTFVKGDGNPESIPSRRKLLDALGEANAAREAAEKRLREREEAEADRDDGEVTGARMRKVLGQVAAADSGPCERSLRRFLEKDYRAYVDDMKRFEAAEAQAKLAAVAADTTLPVDEGEGRVAEAVRELLAKYRGGS